MKSNELLNKLNQMVPNPKCELNYNKDYELLIATVLSAQCTDKRVNIVTKELFQRYNIFTLAQANIKDIESIIMPVGTFRRKSEYILEIAQKLVKDHNGIIPNNRIYLESLPGVGRKTCNVVLANIFDVPTIAVDTHVERVSKRLNLVEEKDDVKIIEDKLMNFFPKDKWNRTHHQLVLFGRYICKSKNPNCQECLLKEKCKYYKEHK